MTRAKILRLATQYRAELEQLWPVLRETIAADHPSVTFEHPAEGMCDLSSVYVVDRLGGIVRGGTPMMESTGGFCFQGAFLRHWWAEHSGYIIDLTADQFGLAPVVVVRQSEEDGQRYKGNLGLVEINAVVKEDRQRLRRIIGNKKAPQQGREA